MLIDKKSQENQISNAIQAFFLLHNFQTAIGGSTRLGTII